MKTTPEPCSQLARIEAETAWGPPGRCEPTSGRRWSRQRRHRRTWTCRCPAGPPAPPPPACGRAPPPLPPRPRLHRTERSETGRARVLAATAGAVQSEEQNGKKKSEGPWLRAHLGLGTEVAGMNWSRHRRDSSGKMEEESFVRSAAMAMESWIRGSAERRGRGGRQSVPS